MSTTTSIAAFDDDESEAKGRKNSQFRSARRDARREAVRRPVQPVRSGRAESGRRGRERALSVRGELRDRPDVGKVARAVIQLALAKAEAEAGAAALPEVASGTVAETSAESSAGEVRHD